MDHPYDETVAEPEAGSFYDRLVARLGLDPQAEADESMLAGRDRRWATRAILLATVILALCNAQSLKTWASTLQPDWGSVTIRDLAAVWADRMADAGFDRPRNAVHDAYERQKAKGWDGK